MTDFAKNLKRIRNNIGLTQEQLAENMHVTRQAISNWENGKTEPDIESIDRMAEILGTTVDDLLYGKQSYVKYQIRYIKSSVISGIVLCVTILVYLTVYPGIMHSNLDNWKIEQSIGIGVAVYVIGGFALGVLIPSVISLLTDIRIYRPYKTVALILGIALAIFPILMMAQCSLWALNLISTSQLYFRLFSVHSNTGFQILRVSFLIIQPFISAFCLFLGINN